MTSLVDPQGRQLVPQGSGLALGEFVHTRYEDAKSPGSVFPNIIPTAANAHTNRWSCSHGREGVEVVTEGRRWGFGFRVRWFFHETEPWIDVAYELEDGWSAAPQAVQFCFPLMLRRPAYRYDTAGAAWRAGSSDAGGDDLPGAIRRSGQPNHSPRPIVLKGRFYCCRRMPAWFNSGPT